MHQYSYIQDVVKRFGMESCRSMETLFDPRIRLYKSAAYVSKFGEKSATLQGESKTSTAYIVNVKKKKASSVPSETRLPYRKLIGCLLIIIISLTN